MTAVKKQAIRGILFDLDGTLLQVEMRQFIPAYARGLAACFSDITDSTRFTEGLIQATLALLKRQDGLQNNEQYFLARMMERLRIEPELFRCRLHHYCSDGLLHLSSLVRAHPLARQVLDYCRQLGLRLVLATNPVFPRAVVEARMAWGGLLDFPFELVTSYENCRFCKPYPGYFTDILDHLQLTAEQCLMVGNDTVHDLGARDAGMTTFLVDTWLEDRRDGCFITDYRGDLADLYDFLQDLGNVAE
ncbi:MAG: HAD family hydrolase [Desulfuromonadaceae bacterium]|jgi:FMN phosphatase YigB (HAD superfamily)